MKYENPVFLPEPTPLRVTILLLPDSNTLSFAATVDPMRAANRRAATTAYKWQVASFDGGPVPLTSGVEVASVPLEQAREADALITVAGFGLEEHARADRMVRLRRCSQNYRALGAVDGGSWILAQAGLLDGVTATTHWEDTEKLASHFPSVNVVEDRFVIDGRFFTTGGAAPCIDMMLALITARQGPEIARRVASAFIYDPVHPSGAPQSRIAFARLSVTAPAVAAALRQMEAQIEDPPTIAAIAAGLGLSTRALEEAFRKTLRVSPGRFFLDLRLQEARRLTVDSNLGLQEIAVRTGFAAQATFSRAFRAKFGQSASELRRSTSSV